MAGQSSCWVTGEPEDIQALALCGRGVEQLGAGVLSDSLDAGSRIHLDLPPALSQEKLDCGNVTLVHADALVEFGSAGVWLAVLLLQVVRAMGRDRVYLAKALNRGCASCWRAYMYIGIGQFLLWYFNWVAESGKRGRPA